MQGVVMEFNDNSSLEPIEMVVLGPLGYDDEAVWVLDGGCALDRIARRDITSARLERRPPIKHPKAAFVVGLGFLGASFTVFFGGSAGIDWLLDLDILFVVAAVFVFIAGFYLIWASVSGGTSPWLVAETPAGQREFPLTGKITDDVEVFVESLGSP